MSDAVRADLRARGAPPHVVEGGLEGLVASWERIVAEVASGYRLGLDDYLNDMDVRQILSEVIGLAPPREQAGLERRIEEADAVLREATSPVARCLWGDGVAEESGWSPRRNWWYYRRPLDLADG